MTRGRNAWRCWLAFSATAAALWATKPPDRALTVSARGVTVALEGVGPAAAPEAIRVVEDQLTLAGDSNVSAPLADDLAFFVQARYFQLGYDQATADWRLDGRVIHLTVKEGTRRTVGTVTISGVPPESVAACEAYLRRPTRERQGLLSRSLPFVEEDVRAGADLVLRHLRALGYLEATASEPVFTPAGQTSAMDITLTVMPGPMTQFGAITLEGDGTEPGPELRRKAEALKGSAFNEVEMETIRASLQGGLQQRGHFGAIVTATAGPASVSGPSVLRRPVRFHITAGPRYAVGAVRVDEALSKGAARVARSVFTPATTQVYEPEGLDLLHRRALDTGLFSRLEVKPIVTGPASLDLSVTGEEAKPKTLGFYGGYESLLGPILGLEARHVNFLDSGNAAAARAEFRGAGGEGSLQLTDPAILGSRWSLATGVSWETFTFADYDRQTAAWRATLARRLTRRVSTEVFTVLSDNEMDTDVLTPEELGPGEYRTATGGIRLTFDFRDHPLLARDGWLLDLAAEGGGIEGDRSVPFGRADVSVGWYQPLTDRWRVSAGARARVLLTDADAGEIPIDLRIFNGGANSVRSFAERELGPMSREGDTPLGGLSATVASVEVSYELFRNFELAAFADAGTLDDEASAFFSVDDLRYGLGLGLRYRLPVGPLRIDYGLNPDRRPGESQGALHVTFGFAF